MSVNETEMKIKEQISRTPEMTIDIPFLCLKNVVDTKARNRKGEIAVKVGITKEKI